MKGSLRSTHTNSHISEVTSGGEIGPTIVIFRYMVQDISDKPSLQFCFVPNELIHHNLLLSVLSLSTVQLDNFGD